MNDERENLTSDHFVSRRSAMQLLGALAGAGAFSGAAVAEDEEGEGQAKQGGDERDEAEDEESPAPPVGTEQLLNYLAARYGDVLSEEDVEALREDVAGNLRNAQAMDEVDLANGDDMALTFRAYRGSY